MADQAGSLLPGKCMVTNAGEAVQFLTLSAPIDTRPAQSEEFDPLSFCDPAAASPAISVGMPFS
jgi:hypothetical protein